MSGLLADIFVAGDRAKKRVRGLLDPQTYQNAMDYSTFDPLTQQQLIDGLLGAGITKVVKPYWHDPMKPPKLDQFGNVRDASRKGSAEWSGRTGPSFKAETIAGDIKRNLYEDLQSKDFDVTGLKMHLVDIAKQENLQQGALLRELYRQVHNDEALPQHVRDKIIRELLGGG